MPDPEHPLMNPHELSAGFAVEVIAMVECNGVAAFGLLAVVRFPLLAEVVKAVNDDGDAGDTLVLQTIGTGSFAPKKRGPTLFPPTVATGRHVSKALIVPETM